MLDRYDIRDLRLFSANDVRALLEQEAALWRERLLWDYAESIRLLLSYVDSRILPGFVAVERATGAVRGYCFSVYETHKAVVGDVFTTGDDGPELARLLLRHMLPMLQHTPGVQRVEAQLLLGNGTLREVFREAGFGEHRRLFMHAELPSARELVAPGSLVRAPGEATPTLPPSLRLVRWTAPLYQPVGDLIHRAYEGHSDSKINDQYRSVQGSLRFLHNIVRFPGCGTFDPEHTFAVRDERSAQVQGVVLVSRVEPDVAHITQICVSPRRRGHGLGRMLLRHAATELANHGVRAITLTVTEDNTPALRLYQSLGFSTMLTFHADVWTK